MTLILDVIMFTNPLLTVPIPRQKNEKEEGSDKKQLLDEEQNKKKIEKLEKLIKVTLITF